MSVRGAAGRVLVARNEEVIAVGDRDDLRNVVQPFEPIDGFLQKAAAVGELDERLRWAWRIRATAGYRCRRRGLLVSA
jgi:hypothetical protein